VLHIIRTIQSSRLGGWVLSLGLLVIMSTGMTGTAWAGDDSRTIIWEPTPPETPLYVRLVSGQLGQVLEEVLHINSTKKQVPEPRTPRKLEQGAR